jgi:hypothetical protein
MRKLRRGGLELEARQQCQVMVEEVIAGGEGVRAVLAKDLKTDSATAALMNSLNEPYHLGLRCVSGAMKWLANLGTSRAVPRGAGANRTDRLRR